MIYLPFTDFVETVAVLRDKELDKLRSDIRALLYDLCNEQISSRTVDDAKIWRLYERSLLTFGQVACAEWKRRGKPDKLLKEFERFRTNEVVLRSSSNLPPRARHPYYLNRSRLALLELDSEHYGVWFEKSPTGKD